MAIDNRLQVFNEEGQSVDYDILASDVKFLPDGKDLPTKLAEMEAHQGDGTVTGVKVGSTPYDPDSNGVVDLSTPFNAKVDKVDGKGLSKNDYTDADKAKVDSLKTVATSGSYNDLTDKPNIPESATPDQSLDPNSDNAVSNAAVCAGLSTKANDNEVVKGISVNGTAQTKDGQGNVNIQVQAGDQVSVIQPDPADGTFIMRVASTDYTINLNHTHEAMAKLRLYTQATMPQAKALDTIYVQVDNVSMPTDIEKLFIAGLEFERGVIPDAGQAYMLSPTNGVNLNLGYNDGSGVSQQINVRGKNLTGALTLSVSTGLSLTYDGTTSDSVTIPMAAALTGALVTIAFSGSGALADGSLVIRQGNDVLSSVVVVVVAELPNGYTRLEYVDNTVRGIDTGILATNSQDLSQSVAGSSWEVDVQCNSAPASNEMVVVANEDVAHWFGAVASAGCFGSGSTDYCFSSPATTRQQIQVAFFSNKIVLTSGGVTKTRNYTYHNNRNVCLLNNMNPNSQQYAGGQFQGKVYSIKCTSGGSFDAVPAQRTSDGKKGLYDKANNVFYPLT